MSLLPPIVAVILAPMLLGIINRTKAMFAGRVGQPLLQPYFDLWKLLGKGAVYSRTTTWVFRAGPMIGLASMLVATTLLPFGSCPAPLGFPGDLILLAYLLGLARLFTVLAALDTGSPFEGMGASREMLFSALAEPALLLGLAAVARRTEVLSLSEMQMAITGSLWMKSGLTLILVAVALGVVLLTENSRIPIDDPTTHLELTMIHEVMVLDHSGPDFAFILYGAALKLWILGGLIIGVVVPLRTGLILADLVLALAAMLVLAIAVGVVESTMARLRLIRVPQLLVGAVTLSILALILEYGGNL
ncbi:MAG: NADH-quinone oxidoreductase subunit H [Planctomycetaceae bacterium]|nr:NADH-quinone oxidoreductase subunit H [Planctomycetaceae bacterium]MBV8553935.1 NADH-quinone oxidoreductase subunit H [Planctomycetaceae bacterium]